MTAAKAKTMPRGQKTQRIRELLEHDPNAMPKDIADTLAKEGITASSALISSIKSGFKEEVAGAQLSLNQLIAAKDLIDKMGGVDNARQAIEAIARLSA